VQKDVITTIWDDTELVAEGNSGRGMQQCMLAPAEKRLNDPTCTILIDNTDD
jgi:hypothetical protein